MKIGVDGNAITLDGEIASYDEARAAVDKIFGFAAVLWPEESAAHDAEIAAAEASKKSARGEARAGVGSITKIKPGSSVEKVYEAWRGGARDLDEIAADTGVGKAAVAMFLSKMRKGGLIE